MTEINRVKRPKKISGQGSQTRHKNRPNRLHKSPISKGSLSRNRSNVNRSAKSPARSRSPYKSITSLHGGNSDLENIIRKAYDERLEYINKRIPLMRHKREKVYPYETPLWFSSIFPNKENMDNFLENLKIMDDYFFNIWIDVAKYIVLSCIDHQNNFPPNEINILKEFCNNILIAFPQDKKLPISDELSEVDNFVKNDIVTLNNQLNKKSLIQKLLLQ